MQSDQTLTTLRPGWLREQLEAAAVEVAMWPDWKRQAGKTMMDELAQQWHGACHCPRRCDEAQTCAGGCIYGR